MGGCSIFCHYMLDMPYGASTFGQIMNYAVSCDSLKDSGLGIMLNLSIFPVIVKGVAELLSNVMVTGSEHVSILKSAIVDRVIDSFCLTNGRMFQVLRLGKLVAVTIFWSNSLTMKGWDQPGCSVFFKLTSVMQIYGV